MPAFSFLFRTDCKYNQGKYFGCCDIHVLDLFQSLLYPLNRFWSTCFTSSESWCMALPPVNPYSPKYYTQNKVFSPFDCWLFGSTEVLQKRLLILSILLVAKLRQNYWSSYITFPYVYTHSIYYYVYTTYILCIYSGTYHSFHQGKK